jgi:antirestriction protein ArdC
MAKRVAQQLTEQERAQRRHDARERLRAAAEQLLSQDGWTRWVQARATLHGYSAINCMLLAQQCHERGITPQHVTGLHAWRKRGRRVRKGETALRISVPIKLKELDEQGGETGRERLVFKSAPVFELSQTEPLPGSEPQELEQTCDPLNGSSHAHLLAPLQSFTESLGYSVSFKALSGITRGWCDTENKQIVVDSRPPTNTQVRALIHECVHALGIDYQTYARDLAEVIAETVTFIVSASIGLTVDAQSVPYVASWGEQGALVAATRFAQTIDGLARQIEDGTLKLANPG